MIQFITKLRDQMEIELEQVAIQQYRDAVKAKASLEIVDAAVRKLKDFVATYEFRNLDEEIRFFKEIKPGFYHQLIYYGELVFIETRKPAGDRERLIAYYRKMIDNYEGYMERHEFLHTYYLLERTAEDAQLFTRNSNHPGLDPEYLLDLDPSFSTKSSAVLSMLIAFERISEHLAQKINYLEGDNNTPNGPWDNPDDLVWTGSVAEFTELIYALHAHGLINRGRVKIQQLMNGFRRLLKVDPGNHYRTYQNLRIRKKRTPLLQAMTESLIKRMDDPDVSF